MQGQIPTAPRNSNPSTTAPSRPGTRAVDGRLLIQVPLYSRALARVIQDRTPDERTELQEVALHATRVDQLPQWAQDALREMGIS